MAYYTAVQFGFVIVYINHYKYSLPQAVESCSMLVPAAAQQQVYNIDAFFVNSHC